MATLAVTITPVSQEGESPSRGTAWSPYKTAALRALHAMTLTCERCGFLVPWVSAKRQAARRRKRTKERRIRKGDGCTGRCKKTWCKSTLYAASQYVWAHELLSGMRVLVARPRTVDDTSVWKEARETTHAVANAVLATYGKDALRGRAREAAETWAATIADAA